MHHLSLGVFRTQSWLWLNQENTSRILCHGFSASGGCSQASEMECEVFTFHQIPPTSTFKQSLSQKNKFIEWEHRWDLSLELSVLFYQKIQNPTQPLRLPCTSITNNRMTASSQLHPRVPEQVRKSRTQEGTMATLPPSSANCAPPVAAGARLGPARPRCLSRPR